MVASIWHALFLSMAEPQKQGEPLPEDVGTDDCLTSYTHIYSPDLLKYAWKPVLLHVFPIAWCDLVALLSSHSLSVNKINVCDMLVTGIPKWSDLLRACTCIFQRSGCFYHRWWIWNWTQDSWNLHEVRGLPACFSITGPDLAEISIFSLNFIVGECIV